MLTPACCSWLFSSPPESRPGPAQTDPPGPPADICRDCSRLQRQLDVGNQRLSAVEWDNQELRQELLQTTTRVERLEKRVIAILAAQTRQRGDLPSDAHVEHQAIARDYQAFVEHHLAALARKAVDISWRRPTYQPALLCLLGELTQALFHRAPTAGFAEAALQLDETASNMLATRLERALAEATRLWQRAERTGLPFRWDFDLLPGARLDPARQVAWPSCDPCLPVQYVIAPAYVVELQVFSLQRVFTGPTF